MLIRHGTRTPAALFGVVAAALIAASVSGCQRDSPASERRATTPAAQANIRTVTVPVDGMICIVCASGVKRALKNVDGVQDAEIDLEKRNATIHYEDGKVSLNDLARTISDLGYKVGVPVPTSSQ